MAGGVQLATAYVSMSLRRGSVVSDANSTLRQVERSATASGGTAGQGFMSRFGGRLRSAASRVGHGLLKGIGAVLKAGAAGTVGLLGYALTKGFQRLSSIDQATHKLTGLGNSAKQTDAIMKNALTSVKGTAFGMDEAATTAAGAVAAGVKPGKALTRTLSLAADAATIAGTSMGDMGSIFNKVATSNKIQGDTIAQLSDKGIPIVQFLAKSLHKSSAEVVDLASKGKINFAQFQTAMQQGLGGAAQQSGDTFTGAMANVKASLGRIGAGLLGGIFPHLAPAAKKLTAAMAPLEDKSKGVGDAIGKYLAKAIQKVPPIIDNLKQKWAEFKSGFNDDQNFTTFQKLGSAAKKLQTAFSGKSLGNGFDKVKDAVTRIVKGVNGQDLQKLFDGLGKSTPIFASGFHILGVALGLVADHADTVGKYLPFILAAVVAHKALNSTFGPNSLVGYNLRTAAMIANSIANSANARATRAATRAAGGQTAATNANALALARQRVAAIAHAVATRASAAASRAMAIAQRLLSAAFISSPIGLIVVGLIALGAGLVLAYKKSATFRRIVNAAFAMVKSVVFGVVNWFKTSFVPFFTKTIPGAFQSVLNFVRSHWKLILGLITGPIGSAVILVISNWGKIKHAFSAAWTWVKGVFSKSWNGLKTILMAPVKAGKWWISHYIALVKKVFTTVWSWASSVFRKSWNGWKNLLTGPISWAKSFIHTQIENIKTNFRNAWSWFSGTFRKSWNGLKALITKPVTAARDALSKALGWGKSGIRHIFDSAVKGIGKIWDGLRKVMTKPLNSVMSLVEKFAHAVGHIPGLGSLKKIKLPRFDTGGKLPGRANGGSIVQGPWRGSKADNVLGVDGNFDAVARVNPGEWYHNVAATRSMQRNFPGALEHINRTGRLPGFANGGRTGGSGIGAAPGSGQSWRWQWALIKSLFPAARLTSAYRPGARTAGDGAMSYHAIGRAIDVGGSRKTMAAVARWLKGHMLGRTHDLLYTPLWGNLGFYRGGWFRQHANTVAQHRNHVHWGLETAAGLLDRLHGTATASGGGGFFDWLADKAFSVPKKIFSAAMGKIPASGMAKMMITGFTSKIIDAVKGFVTGHADGGDMVGLGGSMGSLAAIATGKKMAAGRGWTGAQWSALYKLWSGESGWNSTARNASSGAYGIPQALPGSKMAAAGADWRTNSATQIRWGLDYIKKRYGSPSAAYAKWLARSPHWYGTGTTSARRGLNVVGDRGAELVLSPQVRRFRGGERVFNARETQQLLAGDGNTVRPIQVEINGVPMDHAQAAAREFVFALRQQGIGKFAGV